MSLPGLRVRRRDLGFKLGEIHICPHNERAWGMYKFYTLLSDL